MFGDDIRD
jgi:hypothetical protein